jgi:replicative DNA helicase
MKTMTRRSTFLLRRYLAIPVLLAATLSIGSAAELNPAAVIYKLPDQIPWGPVDARGGQNAVVVGDPNKPGFYMVYTKWTKGNHFSHPHFHPNDRYIVVLQGTWWVGSGAKFDPEHGTVPMPAGSFVTHYGKQVHWDGAKDEDAVLLILRGTCDRDAGAGGEVEFIIAKERSDEAIQGPARGSGLLCFARNDGLLERRL